MKKLIPIIFTASFLGACSLMPDYQRPQQHIPAAWHKPFDQKAHIVATKAWWASFQSIELNRLMDIALVNNNDLLAGLQRIEQSRAALRIVGASLLPAVNGSASATRARETGKDGQNTLRAGAAVAYELDLFGSNRAALAAAEANFTGSQYTQQALTLIIASDVAKAYFTLLQARNRVNIAKNNLANAKEILRIIELRLKAGSVSALDLSQQKSAVASIEAAYQSQQLQLKNAESALSLLLGKAPGMITIANEKIENVAVPNIAPQQPSVLIEHRPDIKAAEAALYAANANIGIARAAFFPKISLGFDVGASAARLTDPIATTLSLASSLTTPIFSGGRLKGGVEQTTARQKELVEIYRKTVLTSFIEVEDALAAVKVTSARERSLEMAMTEARKSHTLSKQLFDAGAIDFQTFLNTQSTLFSAEDTYAIAKIDKLSAAVNLFRALGYGWVSEK